MGTATAHWAKRTKYTGRGIEVRVLRCMMMPLFMVRCLAVTNLSANSRSASTESPNCWPPICICALALGPAASSSSGVGRTYWSAMPAAAEVEIRMQSSMRAACIVRNRATLECQYRSSLWWS